MSWMSEAGADDRAFPVLADLAAAGGVIALVVADAGFDFGGAPRRNRGRPGSSGASESAVELTLAGGELGAEGLEVLAVPEESGATVGAAVGGDAGLSAGGWLAGWAAGEPPCRKVGGLSSSSRGWVSALIPVEGGLAPAGTQVPSATHESFRCCTPTTVNKPAEFPVRIPS